MYDIHLPLTTGHYCYYYHYHYHYHYRYHYHYHYMYECMTSIYL